MSQPSDSVHVLSFKSRARVAAGQLVNLENPTDKNWFITPVLKGEHWQGAGQLQVETLVCAVRAPYVVRAFVCACVCWCVCRREPVGRGNNIDQTASMSRCQSSLATERHSDDPLK